MTPSKRTVIRDTPACVKCKKDKRACDRGMPCSNCRKKPDVPCQYPEPTVYHKESNTNIKRELLEDAKTEHPPPKKFRSSTAFSSELTSLSASSSSLSPSTPSSSLAHVKKESEEHYSETRHYDGASSRPSRNLIIQDIEGDIPQLNSLFTRTVDTSGDNPIMYIYGGSKENVNGVTNDFYQFDMTNLKWKNLTPSLKQVVNPNDPFIRGVEPNPLPSRDNATAQLYRREGRSFVLLFGGSDELGNPTNSLICVDPNSFTWEPLYTAVVDNAAHTKSVQPRSGAGSIIHADKLFIFGGWTRAANQIGGERTADSFSVLDLKTREWIVCDRSYPSEVGSLGYNLDVYAPPCYAGNKALICRGKIQDTKPVNLAASDMFIFNTNHYTFAPQTQARGEFPTRLNWYDISPHRGDASICMAYGTLAVPGSDEVPSELWSFNLQNDLWECQNMADDIWDLDLDLQTLEHVPGKGWCLFGYRQVEIPSTSSRKKSRKKAKEFQSVYSPSWNVCVLLDGVKQEGRDHCLSSSRIYETKDIIS